MRPTRLLTVLSLAALILVAPAGQACAEFARMYAGCRMMALTEMPEMSETGDSMTGHPMDSANDEDQAPAFRCHEGRSMADCCQVGRAPGEIEALLSRAPETVKSLADVAAGVAGVKGGVESFVVTTYRDFGEAPGHDPPPHQPRYALFSSYLI